MSEVFNIDEIEELFKSEDFIKSVNRKALHMLFTNTAMLRDPSVTPEQKQQAQQNIKQITQNIGPQKTAKPKAQPKLKPENVVKPMSNKPKVDHAFPEDFASTHGVHPEHFKASWDKMSPDQKKTTIDWHNEVKASKIKKSIDNLYSLFEALKKQI